MVFRHSKSKFSVLFSILLLFIVMSNFLIYRVSFVPMPVDSRGVVIGSLVDLSILAPLLILALTRKKGFTVKRFVTFMILGLISARFIIPTAYFEPFRFLPYVAIGMEAILLLAELSLICMLAFHLPSIVRAMKREQSSSLFSFPAMVKERVSTHPIISIISAEALMFYYAIISWRQKTPTGEMKFTLHRKTSLIAFNIMLIHAIVIETLGIHWWLHEKSMILSIVLLLLNVYSVVYFIADIQAVRLNPVSLDEECIRISLGLGKRMEIPYREIARIDSGEVARSFNLKDKEVIDFIARDLEEATPQYVLHFKRPLQATLFLGMEKKFSFMAIRVDEPERFRQALEKKLDQ